MAAVLSRSGGSHGGRQTRGRAAAWMFWPVLNHRGAFLGANALYWGGFALGAAYGALDPPGHRALTEAVVGGFSPDGQLAPLLRAYLDGQLAPLLRAYLDGQLAAAIGLTFLVNLFLGALLYVSLPSLALPFAGLLTGVVRALLWGTLFSPTGSLGGPTLLFTVPTIALEGEAYVLAVMGVWLWWRPVMGATGRRLAAWRAGLVLQTRVYAGVALLLALGAIYEAVEVIYLIPSG